METVILDTNFIVTALRFRIDFFSEINNLGVFKLAVLDKTLEELKKLKENKLAIALLKKKKVTIIKTKEDKTVDDLLLEIADKDTIIATQDKILKRRIKEKGIRLLIIRQKKYLLLK